MMQLKKGTAPASGALSRALSGHMNARNLNTVCQRSSSSKIGNPEGCFLAGAWLRCSSVREHCGYLPSSRPCQPPARKQRAHLL
jgi:hypothetical protein